MNLRILVPADFKPMPARGELLFAAVSVVHSDTCLEKVLVPAERDDRICSRVYRETGLGEGFGRVRELRLSISLRLPGCRT